MIQLEELIDRAKRIVNELTTIYIVEHPETYALTLCDRGTQHVVAKVTANHIQLYNQLTRFQRMLGDIKSTYIERPEQNGAQVRLNYKNREYSVICHEWSYGGTSGYLEVMIDEDEPHGWLFAEDAYELVVNPR